MKNIFEILKKHRSKIEKGFENKKWWETSIEFDRNAKAPNGELYDERTMYESIKRSDIERLKRFS